jgi:hypothetical protein
MDLGSLLVGGLPLMAVVIGLVQFAKEKLEWSGKGVEVFAIVIGLLFGFGYHVYNVGEFIVSFPFLFEGLLYGLTIGLSATGMYKVAYPQKDKENKAAG